MIDAYFVINNKEDIPMPTEKAKGKPLLNADLVKKILRAVRPDEREEVKYMLKCMNQLLRWQPSPEKRESGRKLVAKTARQLKKAKSA